MSDAATTVQDQNDAPGTALEQAPPAALIQKLAAGGLSYEDLMTALEAVQGPKARKAPTKVPLPAVLSDAQRKALERFSDVFGKVVPTERRALTRDEIKFLMEEREVVDTIAKMAEGRKEDIRTTVFNHFDVEREQDAAKNLEGGGGADVFERDDKGFILEPDEVVIPDLGKRFVRQINHTKPQVSHEALLALVEKGELSKDDYLAMTTQVRVFDREKMMLLLRRKPELVKVLPAAATGGGKTASCFARPLKA